MPNTLLSYQDFGTQLLETGDLDPIYIMLQRANLPQGTLHKWVLAYWCFYHAGLCSFLAEQPHDMYWNKMAEYAYKSPRGTERRHFRGVKAEQSIQWLRNTYHNSVDNLMATWFAAPTFPAVAYAATQAPLFGPWIAFKVADMGERVLGFPVDFSNADLGFHISPRAGAALIDSEATLPTLIKRLEEEFGQYKAPPYYDRPVNIQEIETILCKFNSHSKHHYPIGKDCREVYHALEGWGAMAKELQQYVPSIR